MTKFFDGLPQQLAFYVPVGRCTTFAETLTATKTGEAFGYRQVQPVAAAIRASDPEMNVVLKELSQLSSAVQQLTTPDASGNSKQCLRTDSSQRIDSKPRQSQSCFRCVGIGHVQRAYALKADGVSSPTAQCPYCSQFGYNVASCMFARPENPRTPRRDRQGAPSGRR